MLPETLSRLSDFVAEEVGLYFPEERWRDLERGISAAAAELGFKSEADCIHWLLSSSLAKGQIDILASHLTVGETYFYRDRNAFDALERSVLPELIASRRAGDRKLRIWSAGCSTGEEPYSIAITLARLIPDLRDWTITILATDINPKFLDKAAEGVFSEWSFRAAPAWLREQCFSRTRDGRLRLIPAIQQMVSFAALNLAEDAFPSLWNDTSAMDVIFCRNVLMYFSQEKAGSVARRFYRSLAPNGWLIVSPIEVPHISSPEWRAVRCGNAVFCRKSAFPPAFVEWADADSAWPEAAAREPSRVPQEGGAETVSMAAPRESPGRSRFEPGDYERARRLNHSGRYEESLEIISAILASDRNDAEAMELLARVRANQGKLDEAEKWCRGALAQAKLKPEAHYLLATVLLEKDEGEEAKRALKRAIYLDPDLVVAHFALGNLAFRQGSYEVSRKHFLNALNILAGRDPADVVPESEGMTAGRLTEILQTMLRRETAVS